MKSTPSDEKSKETEAAEEEEEGRQEGHKRENVVSKQTTGYEVTIADVGCGFGGLSCKFSSVICIVAVILFVGCLW